MGLKKQEGYIFLYHHPSFFAPSLWKKVSGRPWNSMLCSYIYCFSLYINFVSVCILGQVSSSLFLVLFPSSLTWRFVFISVNRNNTCDMIVNNRCLIVISPHNHNRGRLRYPLLPPPLLHCRTYIHACMDNIHYTLYIPIARYTHC